MILPNEVGFEYQLVIIVLLNFVIFISRTAMALSFSNSIINSNLLCYLLNVVKIAFKSFFLTIAKISSTYCTMTFMLICSFFEAFMVLSSSFSRMISAIVCDRGLPWLSSGSLIFLANTWGGGINSESPDEHFAK